MTAVERLEPTSAPAAVQTETAAIFSMIERIATDPNVSLDRVNQAFDFYQKMNADRARKAFDAAMAAAKAEIKPIIKNKQVNFETSKGRTQYKYEDLGEIARTIDQILAQHGLSYRFRTKADATKVEVTCIISHRDGHFEENTLPGPHDNSGSKNSIQAIGSTITYLQRYTLKAALGLAAADDDDGRAAEANEPEERITAEQAKHLADLANKANIDLQIITEHFKVQELTDLTPAQFSTAINKVTKKLKLEGIA